MIRPCPTDIPPLPKLMDCTRWVNKLAQGMYYLLSIAYHIAATQCIISQNRAATLAITKLTDYFLLLIQRETTQRNCARVDSRDGGGYAMLRGE